MVYCNKDIMDVMIHLEGKKIEAQKEESFEGYIRAEVSLGYFVKGLQMAGMSEVKTLKLKRVAMKILTAKLEKEDINDKD